jgi:hypothetical protein
MTFFKFHTALAWAIAAFLGLVLNTAAARAQFPNFSPNPVPFPSPFQITLDNTIRRPTVSPYLNLLMPGTLPGTNYQTLVRPALEQQRINREQEIQMNRLQQQFSSALQSSTSRPQREQGIRPTGHQAAFFYYSRFYFNQQPGPRR